MLTSSKEIDDLKSKEEEAFSKFIEFKKKFNEVNDQLKEKLVELNRLTDTANKYKLEIKKEKQEKEESMLKNREEMIEDKIKRGEKLTTEDLLIFQKKLN